LLLQFEEKQAIPTEIGADLACGLNGVERHISLQIRYCCGPALFWIAADPNGDLPN